jgi:hypothetical protein
VVFVRIRWVRTLRLRARQVHGDPGALVDLALDRDGSPRLMGEAVNLRKAETSPLARVLAVKKGSNTFARASAGMPTPVSLTLTATSSPWRIRCSTRRWPGRRRSNAKLPYLIELWDAQKKHIERVPARASVRHSRAPSMRRRLTNIQSVASRFAAASASSPSATRARCRWDC